MDIVILKMSCLEDDCDCFFGVTCSNGSQWFHYTKEEWIKVCQRISYFNICTKQTNWTENENNRLNLEEIESSIYRYIDIYGRNGTFGNDVIAAVFLKVLKAADYLQIDGADKDLARAIDDGSVFDPGAKNKRALLDHELSDHALLVECIEYLSNCNNFQATQFTEVKRALAAQTSLFGPFYRVYCSDSKDAFQYTEEEWLKLCQRITYFHNLNDYRKRTGDNGKTVTLSEIDSNLYRYIDIYGRKGSFGGNVSAEVFLKVLDAIDFLLIDGADQNLARAIDAGYIFYPDARNKRQLLRDKSMDDLFIECAEVLFDSDRFISTQFTEIKGAVADLTLLLETHYDLYKRLPIGIVEHLLFCNKRNFGLERDVFRVALTRCEHAGSLSDLCRLIRSFRIDWPPQNTVSWILGDSTKHKLLRVGASLGAKWIAGEGSRTFVKSEHDLFCKNMKVFTEQKPELDNFEIVLESLSKFFIQGLLSDESLESNMLYPFKESSKVMKRPRYRHSTILKDSRHRLFEYHPYLRRVRLLALPPKELEMIPFRTYPLVLPYKTSGIWMILNEPMQCDVFGNRSLNWAFRPDPCFLTWFIDFNRGFKRSLDSNRQTDTYEHYEWRAISPCTLPLHNTDDIDGIKIVASNRQLKEDPLVFVGEISSEASDHKRNYRPKRNWTGYFLGHGYIRGYFVIGEPLVDITVTHCSLDEKTIELFVTRLKNDDVADVARYVVDKSEWLKKKKDGIIRITDRTRLDITLMNTVKLPSTIKSDEWIYKYCTGVYNSFVPIRVPSRGLLLIRNFADLSFDESLMIGVIHLNCAILRESNVWDTFILPLFDPKETSPSHTDIITDFVVSTNDGCVILKNGTWKYSDTRDIIIDIRNRKAEFSQFLPYSNNTFRDKTFEEIRTDWKNHKPFVSAQYPPSAKYVTNRAIVPSSRSGFWFDLERGRRDNVDPYDVVNWEIVNRKGIFHPIIPQ